MNEYLWFDLKNDKSFVRNLHIYQFNVNGIVMIANFLWLCVAMSTLALLVLFFLVQTWFFLYLFFFFNNIQIGLFDLTGCNRMRTIRTYECVRACVFICTGNVTFVVFREFFLLFS